MTLPAEGMETRIEFKRAYGLLRTGLAFFANHERSSFSRLVGTALGE